MIFSTSFSEGTILGFNEPNHADQSNLDPETAAYNWLELQQAYPDKVTLIPLLPCYLVTLSHCYLVALLPCYLTLYTWYPDKVTLLQLIIGWTTAFPKIIIICFRCLLDPAPLLQMSWIGLKGCWCINVVVDISMLMLLIPLLMLRYIYVYVALWWLVGWKVVEISMLLLMLLISFLILLVRCVVDIVQPAREARRLAP